jgi:hypothetical protein
VNLLLKEELANKLNSQLIQLNEIKIGVVRESTTLEVLSKNNIKFVDYDSGRKALNALEVNDVNAFASDALIVGNLLKKGVDQPGQPKREPYEDLGYTIYPNSSSKSTYLTSEPTEEYAMAVKGGTPFSKDLLNAINKTLDKSKLSRERQKLKEYETRASDLSWNGLKKSLRFIDTGLWVFFVPVIWGLFIQFVSQILHESWLKTFTWVSGITVCLSIVVIIVIKIFLWVIPRLFPGL